MSKVQRQTKADKNEIVHQELYDDSFLPPAEELAKLHNIKPELVDWMMQRAEEEQKFRHRAYDDRTVVLKETIRCEHSLNSRGLIFCFIVLIFGMGVSGFLIYSEHLITGSIFAGVELLLAASLLYNRRGKKISNMKETD